MPRVRMLVSVAGPDHSWQAGDEIDMSVEDAAMWADGERGELVRGESVETPEGNRRKRGPKVETPEGSQ
jgi:hypothetical protein